MPIKNQRTNELIIEPSNSKSCSPCNTHYASLIYTSLVNTFLSVIVLLVDQQSAKDIMSSVLLFAFSHGFVEYEFDRISSK